jgi:hypothetical protein
MSGCIPHRGNVVALLALQQLADEATGQMLRMGTNTAGRGCSITENGPRGSRREKIRCGSSEITVAGVACLGGFGCLGTINVAASTSARGPDVPPTIIRTVARSAISQRVPFCIQIVTMAASRDSTCGVRISIVTFEA